MLIYITSILRSAQELLLALFDLATCRRRRCYTHTVVVNAPLSDVWRIVSANDIHLVEPDLRIKAEPVPGRDETYIAHVTLRGKALPKTGYRIIERHEGAALKSVYLPELSEPSTHYGEDDISGLVLEEVRGGTRYTITRELTHKRPATRISAPLSMRSYVYLIKREIERQAGTLPATVPTRRWLNQALLAVISMASFVWLFGWTDALIIAALVILHEFGHVLAMWCVGLRVGFVGMVPFVGGVAAAKTPYTSDWQMGFVALMGPGFSLIPAFALYWAGESQANQTFAHASALFAFINAVNLAPIPPLDGGLVLRALLSAMSVRLAYAVAWIGLLAGFAFAAYMQFYLMGLVLVFSVLQLTTQASLAMDSARRRLSLAEGLLLLVLTGLVLAAYAWITPHALALEDLV